MRRIPTIISTLLLTALPCAGFAAVELYSGPILVISASGKSCPEFKGEHTVDLVLRRDDNTSKVTGYFEGEGLVTGHFSGSAGERVPLYYPYQDELRAKGHFIRIVSDGSVLRAELQERHSPDSAEECNFDQAQMTLQRVKGDQAAKERFKKISTLFDAQLMRSEAFALVQKGPVATALPLYEKALAMVDSVADPASKLADPYLTGLANAYLRAGRFKEFNRLYDERFGAIVDKDARAFFVGHRIRALLEEGKADLGRDDFDKALIRFEQAHRLQPRHKEVIAAVMAAYVRAGRFVSAIAFLEDALKGFDKELDRKEISEAIALVLFQKAKSDEKNQKGAEAEISLRRATFLDPGNFHYLVSLARLRHKLGTLEEAETILSKALERFTDEAVRLEIISARDRMRQTEIFLRKLRETEG